MIILVFVMGRKRAHVRSGFVERDNYIDTDTGEIVGRTEKISQFVAGSAEEFFIGYVSVLGLFKGMSGPPIRVYSFILEKYRQDVPIVISLPLKKIMANDLKLKVSTVNNALSDLVRLRMLFRPEGARGVYYINPRYAFKGSTLDRPDSMVAIFELGCKDC